MAAVVVVVALVAAATALVWRADPLVALDLARVVQTLCAAAFTVLAVLRARREPARGWSGLALFGAVWLANRFGALLVGPDRPAGTMSGPLPELWLVGVPAAFLGLHRQCFGDLERRTRWRVVSDAAVLAAAGLLLAWITLRLRGDATDVAAPGFEAVVPAFEVVAAAVVLVAAVYQPARRHLRWAATSIVAAVVGDGVLAHQLTVGEPPGSSLVFAAFVVTAAAAVGAVATPDGGPLPGPDGDRDLEVVLRSRPGSVLDPRRMLLLLPLAAAGVAVVVDAAVDGVGSTTGVLVAVLIAAVVVNVHLVFVEVGHLVGRVRSGERLFRTVFDASPLAMAVTDGDGRVRLANPSLEQLAGRPVDTLDGVGERLNAHDVDVTRPDGSVRRARVLVSRLEDGEPTQLLVLAEDVTAHRAAEAELAWLATHDPLTGLANRHHFEELLAGLLAEAHPDPAGRDAPPRPDAVVHHVTVAFVDLDQFKVVNDSLGHHAGDRLLQACAARLADVVGPFGVVARFGGDEFCLALASGPPSQHRYLVERASAALEVPVELDAGESAWPTASVGVAVSRPGVLVAELLADADAAMYRAKGLGRKRIEWFTPEARVAVRTTHRLVGDLHGALRGDELVAHYQPVVATDGGEVVGAEALVRWQHPTEGLLPPGRFLDVAESVGLLDDVGARVLALACAEAATWPADPRAGRVPSVAVNVAAQQLVDPRFADAVARCLDATGLAADRLWLEITESTLMGDVRAGGRSLRALRRLGVHLAVDDFGTGYSSLTYLKGFPVEALKIDRSFVAGLGSDAEDTAIVGAVIDLGDRLGLDVIAEGVETEVQRELLVELGCPLAQGYLFGRPAPVPLGLGC